MGAGRLQEEGPAVCSLHRNTSNLPSYEAFPTQPHLPVQPDFLSLTSPVLQCVYFLAVFHNFEELLAIDFWYLLVLDFFPLTSFFFTEQTLA